MGYLNRYNNWLIDVAIDEETKLELHSIASDIDEIQDRFYKDLEFGTGGLRGLIGAGTNRMNIYTVRSATQGLANFLISSNMPIDTDHPAHSDTMQATTVHDTISVAIAYDSRRFSTEFAMESALVLAANGIRVYLYESLRSTPQLSFTVRELKCSAGIVITASHNPAEYNGYKVYGPDGGQITTACAKGIQREMGRVMGFEAVKTMPLGEAVAQRLLHIIGEDMDCRYINRVKALARRSPSFDIRIVYTPLHGTGLMPVTRCLRELGYESVSVVKAQAVPDGTYPTVKSPNPEEYEAFTLALEQALAEGADLVMGTDPDCDRVGVAVRESDGAYRMLNGNQIGALLVDYVLSSQPIPQNGAVVKTIVTSELGAQIARSRGVAVFNTLTGFKFIGEKIKEFEETGYYRFLFGYEESHGYLAGTFVRDKDAVIASMLIAEMAAWHRSQGRSLTDALETLYRTHGYYVDEMDSVTLAGAEGLKRIKAVMQAFRDEKIFEEFTGITTIEDYFHGFSSNLNLGDKTTLLFPKSEVIKFVMNDGSWFAVRPSGTEPKIKFYYSMKSFDLACAMQRVASVREFCMAKVYG